MYAVGQTVFFRHPKHSWILGTVSEAAGDVYSCKANDPLRKEVAPDETKKLKADDLHTMQADVLEEDVHDLLNLTLLHDSTLLRCLYIRYMKDVVYTNIGAIVVALNPFNFKIPWYMDDQMPKYLAEGPVIEKNMPHSWAQAHNTYNEMLSMASNQCVLISGESGAGKTEATKIVMKYLAQVSCLKASDSAKTAGLLVGQKLSSCSPFLEAFGNAKTVRNDNSSRFGKFMKVKFTPDGQLVGAHTTKYLLEKSRIITAAIGERVYHAFYVLVRGKLRRQLGLDDEAAYRSINSGTVLHNNEFDTEQDFAEVYDSMKSVGMSDEDIQSVWKVPAGVLSLLNVNFKVEGEGTEIDAATTRFVERAAKVWSVDESVLRHELLTTTVVYPGNKVITKPNNLIAANDTRDALCKASYDGVFSWLVDKANTLCDVETAGNWIGLLDIFGFEDFEKNSFEQLCINLTNETLQNHYNDFIFTKDMEECRREGIDTADIKCPDNAPCLVMIGGRGGIIPLLDEECALGQGSEKSFLEKITSTFEKNVFFGKKKTSQTTFVVHHYAASVTYEISGWLDKNRDTLKDAVKLLMRHSKDRVVAVVLPEPIPQDQKQGKGLTVGGFFNSQLQELMAVINSTNPHWIRCVKPHPAKKPRMFDGMSTNNQLESSGVLGTVKIRKAGYPVRILLAKFVSRYVVVSDPPSQNIADILKGAGLGTKELAQIGTTKVFLKSEAYQRIEKMRESCIVKWAYRLQIFGRGYQGRKQMFKKFVDKNRERLLREKKEREEKARIERERIEAERRAAEERERAAREAEERRRRAEEKRLADMKYKSAVALQRHIRGHLTRVRIFRQVVEEQRARFESERERQMYEERLQTVHADRVREEAEMLFVKWLNQVDEQRRFKALEAIRKDAKDEQKQRIMRRELGRTEERIRKEITIEEAMNRQTIVTRCVVIAKHKNAQTAALAEARAAESTSNFRRRSPKRTFSPAARAGASAKKTAAAAATDARTDALLSEFALNRARAFEAYFPEQPAAVPNTFSNRTQAWDERSKRTGATSPLKGRELFERSKNRWERQEEWLDTREAAFARDSGFRPGDQRLSGATHHDPTSHGVEAYDGLFRTSHAALSELPYRAPQPAAAGSGVYENPLLRTANANAGAAGAAGGARAYSVPQFAPTPNVTARHTTPPPSANPIQSVYDEPPWMRHSGASGPRLTPAQARQERQLQDAIDWESVFNERMW